VFLTVQKANFQTSEQEEKGRNIKNEQEECLQKNSDGQD